MKTCPFCAEEIRDAAIVCKHCGRELTPVTGEASQPTAPPIAVTPGQPRKGLAIAVSSGTDLAIPSRRR